MIFLGKKQTNNNKKKQHVKIYTKEKSAASGKLIKIYYFCRIFGRCLCNSFYFIISQFAGIL